MPGDDLMDENEFAREPGASRQVRDEAVANANAFARFDYHSWLGLGLKSSLNPKPRFRGDEDLWS